MARAGMEEDTEDTGEAATEVDMAGDSEEDMEGVACLSCGPRSSRRPSRWCPRHSTCQLHRRLEEGEELLEVNRESATGVLQFFKKLGSFFGSFLGILFSGADWSAIFRTTAPMLPRRSRGGSGVGRRY